MKLKTREIILVALFAALTSIGAYISIPVPFSAVPITFQMFFSCFAGIILGARLGALSQVVYLILGLVGIPVFAGGDGGLGTILKPSFGFILGFILGAFIIGLLSQNKKLTLSRSIASILFGVFCIYLVGTLYLYFMLNIVQGNHITLWTAVQLSVLPFILKDVILSVVVALMAYKMVPILKKAGLISIYN